LCSIVDISDLRRRVFFGSLDLFLNSFHSDFGVAFRLP
jgi:hypothetical protein